MLCNAFAGLALSLLAPSPAPLAAAPPIPFASEQVQQERRGEIPLRELSGEDQGREPRFDPRSGKWLNVRRFFPVARVVDGDTIWVDRNNRREKLRLLSVDTEEQLIGNPNASPLKPETVFGEECARWAEEYIASLAVEGKRPVVGLAFPGGQERRDVYGRLLCHVILPDGTDYNLMLVREGKSPYFNKYGNSRLMHRAFVAAQESAKKARVGIWDPETNAPETPGAPAAKRPYDVLLPWWQARAEAVDRFRQRTKTDPARWVEAEDPEAVRRAAEAGTPVDVFAGVNRLFDEDDGSLTVLFRSGSKDAEIRARIPADAKDALLEAFDLRSINDPFRQNFVYLRGKIEQGSRGFTMNGARAEAWRVAEPGFDARDE